MSVCLQRSSSHLRGSQRQQPLIIIIIIFFFACERRSSHTACPGSKVRDEVVLQVVGWYFCFFAFVFVGFLIVATG